MAKEKYIITRVKLTFEDGTRINVKTCKEIYNLQSYREYMMAKHNAMKVDFTYDTIPLESERELRMKIVS